jgi:hypothetical protein
MKSTKSGARPVETLLTRPEEKASHFHPCPDCGDGVECFCEFPDLDFSDQFARCADCRNKSLQTR